MADVTFDASGYSLESLWLLALDNNVGYHSGNALRWDNDTLVVLFTDKMRVAKFALELSKRGKLVNAYDFPSFDELTDALANLRDLGATHVAFNSNGPDAERHPINPVILGFQLRG
jgi:hypothetical protein